MKYLDLPGLQHFYDKYIRPIKNAVLKTEIKNDLTIEDEGYVLDARQGKVLDDKITKLLNEKINKVLEELSQEWTRIYDANSNTIDVIKIGNIVFGRFAIYMPDTTERTLTINNKYAPTYAHGFFIPAIRNGEVASNAWLTRENDSNDAKGTLTYKAKEGNYGTYSCTAFWFTSPDVIEEEETNMLRAGNGIDITNNVISVESADEVSDGDTRPIESAAVYDAYGIEYKAGNGINISPDGVISVDTTGSVEDDNQSPVTSDGVYEVSKVAEQKLSEV